MIKSRRIQRLAGRGGSSAHPASRRAGGVRLRDPAGDRGQDVAAAVVPQFGCQLDLSAVSQAVGKTLSLYKAPRHMRVIEEDAVPKLPTGKIDLVSLRALFVIGLTLPRAAVDKRRGSVRGFHVSRERLVVHRTTASAPAGPNQVESDSSSVKS